MIKKRVTVDQQNVGRRARKSSIKERHKGSSNQRSVTQMLTGHPSRCELASQCCTPLTNSDCTIRIDTRRGGMLVAEIKVRGA